MTILSPTILWVALRLRTFEGLPIDFSPMVGFLGVYASQEDAAKDYPDGPFAKCVLGKRRHEKAHHEPHGKGGDIGMMKTGCPFLWWYGTGWAYEEDFFDADHVTACERRVCMQPQCHNYGKPYDDLVRLLGTKKGLLVEPYRVAEEKP